MFLSVSNLIKSLSLWLYWKQTTPLGKPSSILPKNISRLEKIITEGPLIEYFFHEVNTVFKC